MATFHKLLQKQINKHLPPYFQDNPFVLTFLNAVNDSYSAYERDKELMDHSFKESEKEYNEINHNLKKEYELKQQSIANLYNGLKVLDDDYKNVKEENAEDDIVFITNYLNQQIEKRKNTEIDLSHTVELFKTL
ncbi:MAG: hypothetical protein ACRC6O_03320, partial [Flavobacterium sp.]